MDANAHALLLMFRYWVSTYLDCIVGRFHKRSRRYTWPYVVDIRRRLEKHVSWEE